MKVKIVPTEKRIKYKTSKKAITKVRTKKHKQKPKRIIIYSKNLSKVAIKNQIKKPIRSTKKKLKEIDNTETKGIHDFISSSERTISTANVTRKISVKGYKELKKIKVKKSSQKLKIRKTKIKTNVKIKNLKLKELKLRKDIIKTKSNFVNVKELKKTIILKDSKLNLKTKPINIKVKTKVNSTTLNSTQLKYLKAKKLIRKNNHSQKYNEFLINRKKRRYEIIRSEKVSNLDTFLGISNNSKQNIKNNTYLSKEKNKITNVKNINKVKKSKSIGKTGKTKFITNKKQHIAMKKHVDNIRRTAKNSKQTMKASKVMADAISKVAIEAGKVTLEGIKALVSTPYGWAVIAIVVVLLLLMMLITPMMSMTESVPHADDTLMSTLVNELSRLDDEANDYIENIAEIEGIECDKVNYIFNSPKSFIYSPPKEFITLLMVVTENNLSDDNAIDILREIHGKSYEIETDIETKTDSETGEVTTILNVTLTTYDFEQMFDILEFTEEQKDMARAIVQIPFEDMYEGIDFNTPGDGLTDEEIQELLENLPETTPKREKLREVALTLVDYTVYEFGAKANGSIERPTSLDCSGFVAWVYDRAGVTNALQMGGTTAQWGVTTAISSPDVGDLGFMLEEPYPYEPNYNHVGMYIGNGLWVECYSSHGVGITDGNEFHYYRHVNDLDE